MLDVVRRTHGLSADAHGRHRIVPGIRVELIGEAWVVFSPLSGETAFINDACAALLLALQQGRSVDELVADLAQDLGQSEADVRSTVEQSWPVLLGAGLVRPAEAS